MSMRAIAREANVGIATVSRHFPEKSDLFAAIIYDVLDELRRLLEEQLPKLSTDPSNVWSTTIHHIVALQLPAITQEILPELAQSLSGEEMESLRGELEGAYTPVLREAAKYGLCSPRLSPLTFHLGIIMLSRPLPRPANEKFRHELDELVEIFIAGLKPPAEN